MKKLIFFCFFIFLSNLLFCQEKTNIYFFWGENCSRCIKEKKFLEKIKKKYPNVEIQYLEILSNEQNKLLYYEVLKKLNIEIATLPTTIIGKDYFVGFLNEKTTGKKIEDAILKAQKNHSSDLVAKIIKDNKINSINHGQYNIPEKIKIPIFKEIAIKDLSLPILTILFGLIDGFNPCAMWTLIMLLSFLIAVQNRKKMFLLGSIFIFVSAFVYFLFMAAWLNFLIFFSYIKGIKIAIGIVAIGGGIYYLKEFFINKENVCKITSSKFKQKISQKMFYLTENKKIWLAIIGIVLLAFFVNLIELICSAGLPIIYTQILSLSSLSTFQYYSYITLYIFIFMLDDLFIFTVAFFSLQLIKITTKYSRFSHLLGGVVLVILGILLIFKPQYLTF
jgi:thiol-disulfide isomerase/thioredoxin